MGLLNIVKILPFHSLLSYGGLLEKNSEVFKKAGADLKLHEGKAAAARTSGAYGGVREHGLGARTPLAVFFFNAPSIESRAVATEIWLHYPLTILVLFMSTASSVWAFMFLTKTKDWRNPSGWALQLTFNTTLNLASPLIMRS